MIVSRPVIYSPACAHGLFSCKNEDTDSMALLKACSDRDDIVPLITLWFHRPRLWTSLDCGENAVVCRLIRPPAKRSYFVTLLNKFRSRLFDSKMLLLDWLTLYDIMLSICSRFLLLPSQLLVYLSWPIFLSSFLSVYSSCLFHSFLLSIVLRHSLQAFWLPNMHFYLTCLFYNKLIPPTIYKHLTTLTASYLYRLIYV